MEEWTANFPSLDEFEIVFYDSHGFLGEGETSFGGGVIPCSVLPFFFLFFFFFCTQAMSVPSLISLMRRIKRMLLFWPKPFSPQGFDVPLVDKSEDFETALCLQRRSKKGLKPCFLLTKKRPMQRSATK